MDDQSEEHGLRPIGAQALTILHSQAPSDWTPPGKQTNSGTTGLPSQDRRALSSIGQPHGATGAVAVPNARLAEKSPKEVEVALQALWRPFVGTSISRNVKSTFSDAGYETGLTTVKAVVPVPPENLHDLERAVSAHERACQPAPDEMIKAALSALRLMTKVRREEQGDVNMAIAVYTDKLREWPGDLALDVLRTQSDISPWWPAWAELHSRLSSASRDRKTMLVALRHLRRISEPAQ